MPDRNIACHGCGGNGVLTGDDLFRNNPTCRICGGAGKPPIPEPDPLLTATMSGDPLVSLGVGQTTATEPALRKVELWICEPCLNDEPGECHVPGCHYWLCRTDERPNLRDGFCSCAPVAQPPVTHARDCGIRAHRDLARSERVGEVA